MKLERTWAMPNKGTFTIKPIAELINEEMKDGLWIDPFCGENSPAHIKNDLNPDVEADYHLEALDFLRLFDKESIDGGIFYDPPYSPRQIAECYKSVGLDTQRGLRTRANFWSEIKDEIVRITQPETCVISCGWNSMGIGINRGFYMTRILLVPHGGNHNDTIVTVEFKK